MTEARFIRAVEIRSFRGYFFTREWSKFCWVRYERFHPGFNLHATGHSSHVCRGDPFVQIIPLGPLAVLNGCNVAITLDIKEWASQLHYPFYQEGRFLVSNFRRFSGAPHIGLRVGSPATALSAPLGDHLFIYDDWRI